MTPTAVRLPRTYDPELLRQDLDRLRELPRTPQPGPYHDGDWTGLDLYARAGGADVPDAALRPFEPTPPLARAPYLAGVLAGLECPMSMVRLLTLPPDTEIGEHNDAGSNFQIGSLRLHVPIVTHPDVVMLIAGERMRWAPGELWWGDFSQRHRLANDSDVTRVHLVIDVEINDAVLALFPAEVVAEQQTVGCGVAVHRPPVPTTEAELAPYAGTFRLPPALMPLFGGGAGLQGLAHGALAECRPDGSRLVVTLDGRPGFALLRTGPDRFSVVGQPPGVVVEWGPDGPEMVLRGVPEDLYAAQLGFQRGPVVAEQRFPLAPVASVSESS